MGGQPSSPPRPDRPAVAPLHRAFPQRPRGDIAQLGNVLVRVPWSGRLRALEVLAGSGSRRRARRCVGGGLELPIAAERDRIAEGEDCVAQYPPNPFLRSIQ